MNWIKTSEKLPEDDALVLVCNVKGWLLYELALFYKHDNVFVLCESKIPTNYTLEVSHWLPLPNPPTMEKND